ncbi:MAG: ribosome-associated translation inhibitor RaiA [Proteobacteria bacterium]|nr:ribosome-associated translation inhibitor RaiA [Pseudomonadota bacterium]MBU1964267.1 ribosome-associated translation inhibitor RaiA [Pseudomonadota bacterium]
MKISVTFRNAEGETWQKEYVEERLKKLKKYIDNPVDARVILSVEKFRSMAEINLMANGLNVNGKEEDKDMHLAIDNAIEKIERQLKKRKEKVRGFKTSPSRSGEFGGESATEEGDESSDAKVVETRKVVLTPMSIDDAVLEMETTKNRFVIYRDSSTENVNVIYRREDGKFALMEISH